MKLFEVRRRPATPVLTIDQLTPEHVQEIKQALIPAVAAWVGNGHQGGQAEQAVISKWMRTFKYEGPMFRVIFYQEKEGGLNPDHGMRFTNDISRRTMNQGVASWSKTREGMEEFLSYHEDVMFDDDDIAQHDVELSTAHGIGLDVELLYNYAKQIGFTDNSALSELQRATTVDEVIGFPATDVKYNVVHSHRQGDYE